MGQYKNGKWEPTFGDDQFGVVDTPTQMYNSIRDKDAEIGRLKEEIESLREEVKAFRGDSLKLTDQCLKEKQRADELRQEIESLRRDITDMGLQVRELIDTKITMSIQISDLEQERDEWKRRAAILENYIDDAGWEGVLEDHPEATQWFGGEDDRGDDTTDHHGNIPA